MTLTTFMCLGKTMFLCMMMSVLDRPLPKDSFGLNHTETDVGILVAVPKEQDPSGATNDFQLLGIQKLDLETGDGNTRWTKICTDATSGLYVNRGGGVQYFFEGLVFQTCF